jgi:hypothetical protein
LESFFVSAIVNLSALPEEAPSGLLEKPPTERFHSYYPPIDIDLDTTCGPAWKPLLLLSL